MIRHQRLRLWTGALALAVSAPVALLAAPKAVWKSVSGGYRWEATAQGVSAIKPGTKPVSLRALLFPTGRLAEPGADDGYTIYRCTVRPLSLVGTLLSYRRDDYWEGGAHPSGMVGFDVLDAANPNKPPKLTDLFPDAEVRAALLADPIVKRVMKREKIAAPKTSAALVEALKLKYFGGEDDMKFNFPGDLLSQFAFHHLEGGRVAVRLSCPWGTEIYRFQSTQLGLLLKVPPRLKGALERTASGREGFLMREADRRYRQAESTLYAKE